MVSQAEGDGAHGWDLVNPFLQERYGKEEPDDDEKEEGLPESPESSEQPPSYVMPLPHELMPKENAPEKKETPIPLKPDYPVTPRENTPEKSDPRELKSLTEGLDLAKDRIWNDLKYSRGYLQDKFSEDKTKPSEKALEKLPEYENSTPEELEQKQDSLREEIRKNPLQPPRDELKGLEEYQRLKRKGLSSEEIEQTLSDMARWGNRGRQIMEEALEQNNNFPETSGWATAGDVLANAGRMAAPVAAAALAPGLGAALGIGNVASSVIESHAQAQMELDNFERANNKKLSKAQRLGFTAVCMGADFFFDSILQSRFLKNVRSGAKRKASEYFKKKILTNKAAYHEVDRMMRKLDLAERIEMRKGISEDAFLGAFSGGLSTMAHDAATHIYDNPKDYPELNEVLLDASANFLLGGASGAVIGGMGRKINHRAQERRRRQQPSTAYLSKRPLAWEVLDYDPETREMQLLSHDGQELVPELEIDELNDMRAFSVDDYRQIQRDAARIKEHDPLQSVQTDAAKEAAWKKMSTRGKYMMVQDLAHRMGLDNIQVYERVKDLPEDLQSYRGQFRNINIKGVYTAGLGGQTGIVLEELPTYYDVNRALLFEAIGNQGLSTYFSFEPRFYAERFLGQMYKSIPQSYKTGDDNFSRWRDLNTYIADVLAGGIKVNRLEEFYEDLKNRNRRGDARVKLSDNDFHSMLKDFQDDYRRIGGPSRDVRQGKDGNPIYDEDKTNKPLQEVDPETYRTLLQNDPQWRRYKRFYDAVYGEDPANPGHYDEDDE